MGLNNYLAVGIVQVGAATSFAEYWNGDLKHTAGPTAFTFTTTGSVTIANGSIDADIAELMYFDTNLSPTERNKIFCYLNSKYNFISTTDICAN